MMIQREMNIVFYDTSCILCSRTIKFLQQRDKHKKLYYAPIGGSTFIDSGLGEIVENKNTVIFLNDENIFIRSTAILNIFKILPFPWKSLYGFIILPQVIRDSVYIFIAKNRYRWFGKIDSCNLNVKEYSQYFLP